jgi:hypothetical protein
MALEMGESRFMVLFLFFMSGMKRLIRKERFRLVIPFFMFYILFLKYILLKRDSIIKLNKSFLVSIKASPILLRRQDTCSAQEREFAANCSPSPT